MIRTEGLTKRFGSVLAVDGVDLDVRDGDRYGFLGPNGSGKTTTVRMLLGLVFATSGSIELIGQPVPKRARHALIEVGALIEGPAAYGHLSGGRNLMLMDAAGPGGPRRTRRARVAEVLEQVGLDAVGRRPVKAYSLGMRQRLGLAAALLRKPRLLVLDEPTNGLDPQGIREVRDLLVALNEQGTTVFLSSHLPWRGRGAVHARGSARPRPARAAGEPRHAATPDGACRGAHLRPRCRCGVLDGQLEHRDGDRLVVRGLAPEELTGTSRACRRAHHRAGRRAADARRRGARGDQRRLRSRDRRDVPPFPGPRGAAVIAVELAKLLRRPRTWISIALLCLLPAIVAVFLAATDVAPRPGEGPAFLSAVLANGALFPAAALGIVLPLFLPVAVAVVAGDSVAGEASTGTLRYLLVRPVGRTRLLFAKLVSVMAFLLIAVTAVAVTAYIVGTRLLGGAQDTIVTGLSGSSLTKQQLVVRTLLVILYIAWSMLGVASVALFLSTVTDSGLGAALGALAVLVISQVLVTLDAASSVKAYLPTRYWLAWVDFFRRSDPVAGHRARAGRAGRLRRRAPSNGVGELHDPRRHCMT